MTLVPRTTDLKPSLIEIEELRLTLAAAAAEAKDEATVAEAAALLEAALTELAPAGVDALTEALGSAEAVPDWGVALLGDIARASGSEAGAVAEGVDGLLGGFRAITIELDGAMRDGALLEGGDAPAKDATHEAGHADWWGQDHETDWKSGDRYDIQTDPNGDSETVVDPTSGRDYQVVTTTDDGAADETAHKDDDAVDGELNYDEPTITGGGPDYYWVETRTYDEDFEEDTVTGEWMTREEYERRYDEYKKGQSEGDGGDGGDSGADGGGEDGGSAPPADDGETQETPRQGDVNDGPPPVLEEKAPGDGLTQPRQTGDDGPAPDPADHDDGLAPLILTDPDQDRIDFTPPPGGPTYGLTQPILGDDEFGGATPAPDSPDGSEIMVSELDAAAPDAFDMIF